jgi:putative spermidine/putrescine transport system ATP-binding protein
VNAKNGASIQLRELTKTYGRSQQKAVDSVSLDIRPGEFMTFLGPSGSGKTTTLNMIAGFADVTSGSIHIDDRNIVDLPPHQRNLGVVFQQYALFPHMTVEQNIAFPLERRKLPKAEIRTLVAEVIDRVHLNGLAERRPSELSGGQQQRVAVARSIVFGPRVLLMDEPLGALDKKLREKLQGEIARMHRELGLTIVFVTHDQHEALALSDRIAVFNNGRVEQVGTAEELYETPSSLFVADFVGDSTIIEGRYESAGRLRRSDGALISAGRAESMPEGAECSLIIRPERIRVRGGADAQQTGGAELDAVVTDIVYFGEYRKVHVELRSGGSAVAKESAGDWSSVEVRSPVRISWAVDNGVLVSGRAS